MSINCPKCRKVTHFLISDAQDSEGEVFRCEHCGFLFHYVLK